MVAVQSQMERGGHDGGRGDYDLFTDASGTWGCGALFGRQWFQLEWADLGTMQGYGIMAKE